MDHDPVTWPRLPVLSHLQRHLLHYLLHDGTCNSDANLHWFLIRSAHTLTHTHAHTRTHTHTHTCTHTHARTRTHMRTRTHAHAHTHARTCTHARTHYSWSEQEKDQSRRETNLFSAILIFGRSNFGSLFTTKGFVFTLMQSSHLFSFSCSIFSSISRVKWSVFFNCQNTQGPFTLGAVCAVIPRRKLVATNHTVTCESACFTRH